MRPQDGQIHSLDAVVSGGGSHLWTICRSLSGTVAECVLLTHLLVPIATSTTPAGTRTNVVGQTARPTAIARRPPTNHAQAIFILQKPYSRLPHDARLGISDPGPPRRHGLDVHLLESRNKRHKRRPALLGGRRGTLRVWTFLAPLGRFWDSSPQGGALRCSSPAPLPPTASPLGSPLVSAV